MGKTASEREIQRQIVSLATLAAVLGGIGGGIAFGTLWIIQAPDLSVFKGVGTTFLRIDDPIVGALVHISIAIVFGTVFGLSLVFVPRLGTSQIITVIAATIFGILIWGTLAKFIPSLLNQTPFDTVLSNYFIFDRWISEASLRSLVGHILYGFFLGIITL